MRTFTDALQRPWVVEITVSTLKRVRALAGVDLMEAAGGSLLDRLVADPVLLGDVLYACVKPQAALYMFPRLDPKVYPIADDRQFFLELLEATRVMLVQGTGFNWATPDHFRIVFLPHEDDLREAIGRVARHLETWRRRHAGRAAALN